MDQTLIVALACENKKGEVSFIYLEEPKPFNELKMVNDAIYVNNIVVHYKWYDSITICSAEVLDLYKQTLQIA